MDILKERYIFRTRLISHYTSIVLIKLSTYSYQTFYLVISIIKRNLL
nr:hypothetical protein TDPV-093 [Oriental turtle dovepox virus]